MPTVTVWQEVSLLGGPFDGQVHVVDPQRLVLTIECRKGTCQRLYGGELYDVQLLDLVSYRRISDTCFQHCRTPTGIGDTDLDLPETQLELEEDL